MSDRTLASVGPVRPVSGSSEGADIGLRLDAGIESDLTRRGRVRSALTYADVLARDAVVTRGRRRRIGRRC
jgi:hypothetical protein